MQMIMMNEQRLLKLSIVTTILIAMFGIVVGFVSGSSAISFDGFYSLSDAFMTVLALLVSRLITTSASPSSSGKIIDRFSLGFWHLEPMVLGLNGTLLMGAAGFALVGAVDSLMTGGRPVELGPAVVFASVSFAVAAGMGFYQRHANATLMSDFIALDAKSWFMSAAISAALLCAFLFGMMVDGTALQWVAPFIDPVVLAGACVFILPAPIANVRQAVADILLVAPLELREHVDAAAQAIVAKHGFLFYRAYVARVGRLRQIELFFIAPEHWPAKPLNDWDAIRDEVGELIGGEGPDRWLTIVFTSDREWAE